MYLEQNIFGHNLLKFQFNISSLAIFILQSKFKKKYFLIFSSSQPITSPVLRHVIFASSPITIICSPESKSMIISMFFDRNRTCCNCKMPPFSDSLGYTLKVCYAFLHSLTLFRAGGALRAPLVHFYISRKSRYI